MKRVIYITTNLITGHKYIGKSSRNSETYLGSGTILKNAIKKYGIENFKKEIIEECETLEELNEREYYWIQKYNAVESNEFYNLVDGGHGGGDNLSNHPHLDEIRKKISIGTSKAQMGRKHSKETIEKIRKSNIGIKKSPHTEEWKLEISSKLKGKKKPERSEEHRKNISDANKGKIPHNKGTYKEIPTDILEKIIEDNKNGKSIIKISKETGYSRHTITTNINKLKESYGKTIEV